MSLTSSLYAGTSGLTNTGNSLQVTSNNISNINTIGFKKGTTTFADTLYQTIGTNGGSSQVGLGMNIDSVSQVFTDGSLETTSNSTDLAIGGNGFFVVSEQGSDLTYYTRAGNFSFDESGALSTTSGYILQGWNVDPATGEEYGAITDLIVTDYTSPPDDTEELTLIVNLDADAESLSTVLSNAFEYDEDNGTTLDAGTYEYQTVLTAYDALGGAHEVTVYFDKASDTEWEYIITCDPDEDNRSTVDALDSAGLLARGTVTFSESSGEIVSMTMEEYTGQIGDVTPSGNNTVDTVNFEIKDTAALSEDEYEILLEYTDADGWVGQDSGTVDLGLTNYPNAKITYSDENTIYIALDATVDEETDIIINLDEEVQAGDTLSFDINNPTDCNVQDVTNLAYEGATYGNTTLTINNPSAMTTSTTTEEFSLEWDGTEWTCTPPTDPTDYSAATVIAGDTTYVEIDLDDDGETDITFTFEDEVDVVDGVNPLITFGIEGSTAWREVTTDEAKDTGYLQFTADFLGGEGGSTETGISFNIGTSWDGSNWVNDSLSSTQYARSSSTTYQDADGYASGDLQGVEVNSDGLISGTYSNGQTMALFLVALADFNNCNGLKNVGENLYAATTDSGAAVTNKAGQNGLGTISSYSLESSNVDISEEFVSMIELQSAYEANAKIISTVDDMMSTVIAMKR